MKRMNIAVTELLLLLTSQNTRGIVQNANGMGKQIDKDPHRAVLPFIDPSNCKLI